ncbi:hypothetical protein [Thermocrispum sp.]|uniref:hypothetical protein n=1 Tax=Thermocrispum sp. TaxID=2060768 RepID=UPI00257B9D04|nr:hypothetical protein [Thermocrispum sp.]
MTTPHHPDRPDVSQHHSGPYGRQHYPPTGGFPVGGCPPQPPKKKSGTAVMVGIIAVVAVVLGTLGITGFVAPGFLLSGDEEAASGSVAPTKPEDPKAAAKELAEQIVAGYHARDRGKLEKLRCPGEDAVLTSIISDATDVESVELTGEVRLVGDAEAEADMSMIWVTIRRSLTLKLTKQGDGWCWSGVELHRTEKAPTTQPDVPGLPTLPGMPDSEEVEREARKLTEDFAEQVNNGDKPGALALTCEKTAVQPLVEIIMDRQPRIELGATTATGLGASTEITGSRADNPRASGSIHVMTEDEGATWCVASFFFR